MKLEEINWPVFKIGPHNILTKDTVTYVKKEIVNLDDMNKSELFLVIDDKSIPSTTIGGRRLVLASQEINLFKLRTAIYFLGDLIKISKPTDWFIDNSGNLFQYKKSTRAKLVCRYISKVLPGTPIGSVLELKGVSVRFRTLYSVDIDITPYVGVLHWGRSLILYGLYDNEFKNTFRLV